MADKKREIENSFQNTSCGSKLSKLVKWMGRWVMDALKHEDENGKVFHCNDIALIIRDNLWYLKKANFNRKKNLLQL